MSWRLSLALVLVAGVAHADPLPRSQVRSLALTALVNTVQLDDAAAARVQAVVERYREPMESARIESTTTLHELRLVLRDEHPDERRIKKLAEALVTRRAEVNKLRAERLHDMSRVLTPSQFGRLLVSWRAVNRALQREARHA